jgi:glycosyltransferase involved in cell wall biosynthesis
VGHQPRFAYVSFHDMRPGQAASTHVLGLYGALRERGWKGPLLAGSADGGSRLTAKLARYLRVLQGARQRLGSVELLYVRAHPVALPLLRAARRRGVPVVLEVNGTSSDLVRAYPGARLVGRLLAALDRSLVRSATRAVTVSDALARHLVSLAPGVPVVVVANAADPEVFRPGATTALSLPSRYVAFCGALAEWQGVEVMLAATRSAAWPSDVSLVIAGDGPLAPRVVEDARENGVVAYLGVVPQPEVGGILAGSLAGLSPNTRRRHAGDAVKLWGIGLWCAGRRFRRRGPTRTRRR